MKSSHEEQDALGDASISSILGALGRDNRRANDFVGTVVRESASAFGESWARQFFGARAENALITGRIVSVCSEDNKSLMAEWEFPNEPEHWRIDVERVRFLCRVSRLAEWAARNPQHQIGRAVARVFDFGLQSGKVYTGVVLSYLGDDRSGQPLWKVRHTDGDEEDLDEHELARAYLKLEENKVDAERDRRRRREGVGRGDEDEYARKRRKKKTMGDGSDDITLALSGPITYSQLLGALSRIEFPVQSSRTNVIREGASPPRGLVLGAVNIRAHGGIQIAQATRDKPNLARLLASFFQYQCGDPEFTYTTIQINANYQAALHVDKFNLGPSYIVGVGDWEAPSSQSSSSAQELAGKLWVQGCGALDCREAWVAFDGNTPHCTMPFSGTRYTIVYFTHCSQSILQERDRTYLSDLGFDMPHRDMIKAPHMRTAEDRLEAGRVALNKFLESNGIEDDLDTAQSKDDERAEAEGAEEQRLLSPSSGGVATVTKRQLRVVSSERDVQSTSDSLSSRVKVDIRENEGPAIPLITLSRENSDVDAAEDDEVDEEKSKKELVSSSSIAIIARPKFKAYLEPWEAAAAYKKDERGGERLRAKYVGLHMIDDDPYELAEDLPRRGKLSDGVVEGEREMARQAKARGKVLKEHRVVVGVEWCRFARRWTAVTQMVDARDDAEIEKYPLDRGLIGMIVAASDFNDVFDFFDATDCRRESCSELERRVQPLNSRRRLAKRNSGSETLPIYAISSMIEQNLGIVVGAVNPKRGRSAERYERYKYARTTQEYLKLGGSKLDLQFDMIRDYVSLTGGADWRDLACVEEFQTRREVQRAAALCPERACPEIDRGPFLA